MLRGAQILLIVADCFLVPLMCFLRFQRQCRGRTRFQATERNRLTCHFTIAIGSIIDPTDGSIDFGDQLTLPVTSAKLKRFVTFSRSPVHNVG